MKKSSLLAKLLEVEKYFVKPEDKAGIAIAHELFERKQFDLCEKQLDKFPTRAQLLSNLVNKLKGKSVYKTLLKLQEGKVKEDKLVVAKGLSSLLTHAILEVEHGNTEYKMLFPSIVEKLNEIMYDVLKEN